ncbi:ctenidin-3-like [Xyrauchen texanus]|uniref:ctenidin-3-like n=1 Tax=Xyrauchen texanus TaxID=154827 RepID=UPI0022420295|nr:ctenidin-3-like [Xyrauchen texanus]
MFSQYKIFSLITCLFLLTMLFPAAQPRRGGAFGRGGGNRGGGWGGSSNGGWGGGGGQSYRAPPVHTGGSSGSSAGRVAGAAAAGALGGMLIGQGLSSMARPGYGYGGYEGYGHGYGQGYPRYGAGHVGGYSGNAGEFRNETNMDYYTGAASAGHIYSCVTVLGPVMSFLFGKYLS